MRRLRFHAEFEHRQPSSLCIHSEPFLWRLTDVCTGRTFEPTGPKFKAPEPRAMYNQYDALFEDQTKPGYRRGPNGHDTHAGYDLPRFSL